MESVDPPTMSNGAASPNLEFGVWDDRTRGEDILTMLEMQMETVYSAGHQKKILTWGLENT